MLRIDVTISKITVDIPALDRLVTYLETQEQIKLDALTKQVTDLTTALAKSNTGLTAIEQENK